MTSATGTQRSIFPQFPNMLPMQPMFGSGSVRACALPAQKPDTVTFGNRFEPTIHYGLFGLSEEGVKRFETAEREWREQMEGMTPDNVTALADRIKKLSGLTLITFTLDTLDRDQLQEDVRRYTKRLPKRLANPINRRFDNLISRLLPGEDGKADFGGGVFPLGRHNLMLVNLDFSNLRGAENMTPRERAVNQFLVLAHESVHAHHARQRLLPVNIGNKKNRGTKEAAKKAAFLYNAVSAFAAEQIDISGLYARAGKVVYHEKPEMLAAIKPMLVTECIAYQLEAEVAEKFSTGDDEFDAQNVMYLRSMANGFMEVLTALNDVLLP